MDPGGANEDIEVLGREDQLRNKKDKKSSKKGDSSKPKRKSKSRKGKGKKKTASGGDKSKVKPGAKARRLLQSAKKTKQDSDEVGDEGARATPAAKAKAKAKSKAATPSTCKSKAKAKPSCKKPAASDNVEPPKKRIRRKTSQDQQWEYDENLFDQELYDAMQDYVYKFDTEDAGNQFKKKVKYLLNFQMLHCSIDPYYSRQCCITKAPKDITADGKDTSWCFSFHGDSEKNGPHWQFEMACSIMRAHLMVPRFKYENGLQFFDIILS